MTLLLTLSSMVALAEPPLVLGEDYLRADALPDPPPDYGDTPWNVVDLDDLTVVRMPPEALVYNFTTGDFRDTLSEALAGRSATYDIAIVTHSDSWTPAFGNAAAFHLGFNNADVWGTGRDPVVTPEMPLRSGLWMNHVDYWDSWPADTPDWVFCHEVGHQWLAYPELGIAEDGGAGDSLALLGRQRAHWSYFFDTDNSPMEGNAWVDNGDGTYTTDLSSGMVFGPLDLYMMGLADAEDVPPQVLLVPSNDGAIHRETAPQHLWDDVPVTLAATPLSVPIDDIIAANGPWQAGDYTAAHIQALHVVLLAPEEALTDALLDRARQNRADWLTAWGHCTAEQSVLELGVLDEGWTLPDLPDAPAAVPPGAW